MMPERWERIEQLYHSALKVEASQRAAFLQDTCGGDESLRQEVESLLAGDRQAENFLESPALELAAKAMVAGRSSLDSSADDDLHLIGKTISHYRVLEKLGGGGMGVVYKAKDVKLGRFVALKFLPRELLQDPRAVQQLEAEARAASALNHPHICTVYDTDEYEGRPFIVMEMLEGQTLKGHICSRPLDNGEIGRLGVQIADALEAAHTKGIIHRDIKPANIFITHGGQVKLLDFGLAKLLPVLTDTAPTESLMETRAFIGTLPYMAAEQLQGGKADVRTDIHAVGAVLYEMATGQRPFREDSAPRLIDQILHKPPTPPRELNRHIPPQLQAVIQKCLEKDPAKRYQHAKELLEDIAQLARPVRPARLGVLVIAMLLLVLAVGALVRLTAPKKPVNPSEWVQITNFPDSVTQPALSSDGRMLAFLRGPNTFAGESELYVKLLPDGEPTQLTRDGTIKMSPAFSPDNSLIAYTVVGGRSTWDTWVVPVLGGTPDLWLPNASGLVWIDNHRLLFSEIKSGIQMGIVTSLETRGESRDIYLPGQKLAMAHRSFISPDGKWVLIAEHDEKGYWRPCRLAPFDGTSVGRPVGPPDAPCMFAAWSPKATWMYLDARADRNFHLWRQRFPDGKPEQLTAGPTEEEGIAVAPDGASLITAVGLRQRPIWFHDGDGDRQVSREGYAFWPQFYAASRKVLYRSSNGYQGLTTPSEVWAADLDSGRTERVLPGFQVISYDLSSDGRLLVCALDSGGKPHLWLARLDHRSPPRQIGSVEATQALFGPPDTIFFLANEGTGKYLFEIREDGTGLKKIVKEQVNEITAVSTDGQWISGWRSPPDGEAGALIVGYPVNGGAAITLCDPPCLFKWAPNGKYVYVSKPHGYTSAGAVGRTYVLPTLRATMFPEMPAGGFRSEAELATAPGARVIEAADVGVGPTPDVYVVSRESTQRNLYRIPLR